MEFQKYIPKFFVRNRKHSVSEKDNLFISELSKVLGFSIKNPEFYFEAFSLKSSSKKNSNYERLEFLGDAVLGSIISCYLFENYPNANEGYLTQMKSKIVNRKNLNKLGDDLNLTKFIRNGNNAVLSENISGNLFEALIGAIFLDTDYENSKKIVLEELFSQDDFIKLENKIVSYKGLLLEWSQKKKCILRYETCEEQQANKAIVFRSYVWLDDEKIANATESSKKKAEEKAAQRAFYFLNKKENIIERSKVIS